MPLAKFEKLNENAAIWILDPITGIRITEGKPITGYETYLACRNGRIYSTKRRKFLCGYGNGIGYSIVTIFRVFKGKREFTQRSIHRLIALAWVPRVSDTDIETSHINLDKTDCRPENLMWSCRKETMNGAIRRLAAVGKVWGLSAYWQNLTVEESRVMKLRFRRKIKVWIKNRTPEQKETHNAMIRDAWARKTPEQRKEIGIKQAQGRAAARAARTQAAQAV